MNEAPGQAKRLKESSAQLAPARSCIVPDHACPPSIGDICSLKVVFAASLHRSTRASLTAGAGRFLSRTCTASQHLSSMLAALIALLMGPASVIYVLGPLAGGVLFLPLLGVQLGVTLGIGVTPGTFTAPDYVTGEDRGVQFVKLATVDLFNPCRPPCTLHLSCSCTRRHPADCVFCNAHLHDRLEQAGGVLLHNAMAQVQFPELAQCAARCVGWHQQQRGPAEMCWHVTCNTQLWARAGTTGMCKALRALASTPHAAPSQVSLQLPDHCQAAAPMTCIPRLSQAALACSARSSTPLHCFRRLMCAGHRPTMRCPSCEARVHDSAFHKSDRLVR